MNLAVHKLSSKDWEVFAENAHRALFAEIRPASFNRIDFALLVEDADKKEPVGYGTYRELDSESVYMQYGGCFPNTQNTANAYPIYCAAIDSLQNLGFKRANTLIENENIPMLKFAFKKGFRIIGVRVFDKKIYCELLKEFQ